MKRIGVNHDRLNSFRPQATAQSDWLTNERKVTLVRGASLGLGTSIYSQLSKGQFRLVSLWPSSTSVIRCDMVYASLNNPPPYKAVSYAWGDPADTRQIIMDGDTFDITATLYEALAALLHRTDRVLVWADSVCIYTS
jgi:hypothetical protein